MTNKKFNMSKKPECNGDWKNCPLPFCKCAKEYLKDIDEEYQEEFEATGKSFILAAILLVVWLLCCGSLIGLKFYDVITWSWWLVTLPLTLPVLVSFILFLLFMYFSFKIDERNKATGRQ